MPNYEFDDDTGSINSDWLNPVGNWTYGPPTKTIAKTLTPEDGVKIYPQGSDGGVFIGGTNVAGYYDDDSVLDYGTKFKPSTGITDGTIGWERDYSVVSVEFYGISLDGVTDYSAAFLEASVTAGNSSVFVPVGAFKISSGDFTGKKFHSFGPVIILGNDTLIVNDLSDNGSQFSIENRAIIFITFGQSNSVRYAPRVSENNTPPGLFTFNGGAEKGDDTASIINILNPVYAIDMQSTVAYNENGEDAEGSAPGFASGVLFRSASRVYTWSAGFGGAHWRSLKPGAGTWTSFVQALTQFKKFAIADGFTTIDYVFYWDHGEAEADNLDPGLVATDTPITKTEYVQLLTNVNSAISDYLDYTDNVVSSQFIMLFTPLQFTGLIGGSFTYDQVQQAQHEYCLTSANSFLVGGKSQHLSESDNVHTLGLGRRHLAEKAAQVYNKIKVNNEVWTPLHMTSATRSGTTVTVTCSVPDNGNLVIDTTTITDITGNPANNKYGFEFYDNAGSIVVSDLTVLGNVITLTLATTPSGVGEEVRVAQMRVPTATTSALLRPRSNIRSDANIQTSSLDGQSIYDFIIPHKIEVT